MYTRIMNNGGVPVPGRELRFYKVREKVSGAMWEGKTVVEYRGMCLHFDFFHHFSHERDMTLEEAQSLLWLRYLERDGEFYDLYWYSLRHEGRFYLHPIGWFGNEAPNAKELKAFADRVNRANNPYNSSTESVPDEEFLLLGFERILELEEDINE